MLTFADFTECFVEADNHLSGKLRAAIRKESPDSVKSVEILRAAPEEYTARYRVKIALKDGSYRQFDFTDEQATDTPMVVQFLKARLQAT